MTKFNYLFIGILQCLGKLTVALKREKREKETIAFLPRARLYHVFHSSPARVIFCAHMLTTDNLQMKGQPCKKIKNKKKNTSATQPK